MLSSRHVFQTLHNRLRIPTHEERGQTRSCKSSRTVRTANTVFQCRGAAANAAGHGQQAPNAANYMDLFIGVPSAADSPFFNSPGIDLKYNSAFFTLCYVGAEDIPKGLGVPESPDPLVISASGGPDLLHTRLLEGSVADGIHDMTQVTVI
jgi:hypothetical protein